MKLPPLGVAARVVIAVVGVVLALSWASRRPPEPEPWQAPEIAAELPSRFVEDLTWLEVDAALARGVRTILIPTGGTEQNGPHVILGKHNRVVRETARRIAEQLGDALVAPVIAYVPEGRIEPPEGHMQFAGTISLPEDVFRRLLESAARSFAVHGFREVYFVGDSGENQVPQQKVAEALDAELRGKGILVHQVGDYYGHNGQVEWLKSLGESDETIGRHAGIRDTSEMLAAAPDGVREGLIALDGGGPSSRTGVVGDPRRATAERGRELLQRKVDAAVAEIQRVRRERQVDGKPSADAAP